MRALDTKTKAHPLIVCKKLSVAAFGASASTTKSDAAIQTTPSNK
ncbi:hypothetical protein [Pelagicoccus enzymogenes]|nr:hypothetical protein [Pelagicoccus enzymogenes]